MAAINGLEVPLVSDFQMGVTNKSPEFLAKFPLGKVPALECADGFCIAETAAICVYLATSGPAAEQLLGPFNDPKARATITQWSAFASAEIGSNAQLPVLMALFKLYPMDEGRFNTSMAALERALRRLEVGLKDGRSFLVGDKVTLADIMVFGTGSLAAMALLDADMQKELPHVTRYLKGLAGRPEFQNAFGELKMTEARLKA